MSNKKYPVICSDGSFIGMAASLKAAMTLAFLKTDFTPSGAYTTTMNSIQRQRAEYDPDFPQECRHRMAGSRVTKPFTIYRPLNIKETHICNSFNSQTV